MTKTQKIKSLIINLVLVVIFSSLGIFASYINAGLYNTILDKGRIVSTYNSTLVHFISVGQGDAIAINLPDGKVAVIDTGLIDSNVDFTNYLTEKVLNTSKNDSVDYLILTHADTDHTGGAMRLIQEFKIKNIVMPVVSGESLYYENLVDKVLEKNINIIDVENNNELNGKNYSFKFFLANGAISTNDSSHVIKLESFNKSFLFTGDISSSIELQLVERYGNVLDCDVLKVPHHGSKYSSSEEFLNVVTPKISVVCCGKNSYGHPTSEVIENVLATGSKIYRTDKDGSLVVAVNKYYNLNVLNKTFKTVDMSFEIEIFIIATNFIFLIDSLIIFFKKEKRGKLRVKNKLKISKTQS